MGDIVHPFGKKKHEHVEIDPLWCLACGYCSIFCVMHCIHQRPDGMYEVDQEQCIGCRSCRVNCYFDAVRVTSPER